MRHSSELDILCKSHFSILCVTLNTYLCREQREDTSPTLCGIRMLDRGAGAGPGQTLTAKVIINQPPTPSLLNGLLRFSASAFSLRADTHNRQMGPLSFSFFFFLKSLSGVHCVPLSVCLSVFCLVSVAFSVVSHPTMPRPGRLCHNNQSLLKPLASSK